jgi:hypothetical protein
MRMLHQRCVVTVPFHSDEALKRYLVQVNEEKFDGQQRFIIEKLDDTHLFIQSAVPPDSKAPDMTVFLQRLIDDWHDANSFQELEDDIADPELKTDNAGKGRKKASRGVR